jgi:hypothetical protein
MKNNVRSLKKLAYHPKLRMMIILWANSCNMMRSNVRSLKKILRLYSIIKWLHKRQSCRPICKELKVLTVTALYIFEVLIFIYLKKKHILEGIQTYMSTTPEESMISIIQAVIHHSSNGV